MYDSGEEFLNELYKDLHVSKIVMHTALKSDTPVEKISKYLTRIFNIFLRKKIPPHIYPKYMREGILLFIAFLVQSYTYNSTLILLRCQMSFTYSSIVLSEENFPTLATFNIADFAHAFSSLYAASTFF